jgi:gelsolin
LIADEGTPGVGAFFKEFDSDQVELQPDDTTKSEERPTLYRLSDASGKIIFEPVADIHTSDAYILDASSIVYVWIGKGASKVEKRLVGQYAQAYLYEKASGTKKVFH